MLSKTEKVWMSRLVNRIIRERREKYWADQQRRQWLQKSEQEIMEEVMAEATNLLTRRRQQGEGAAVLEEMFPGGVMGEALRRMATQKLQSLFFLAKEKEAGWCTEDDHEAEKGLAMLRVAVIQRIDRQRQEEPHQPFQLEKLLKEVIRDLLRNHSLAQKVKAIFRKMNQGLQGTRGSDKITR